METHAHEQVQWQAPRASVATTEGQIQTLYSSTPHWSWWVGHGIFGATLGRSQRAAGEARRLAP